MSALARSRQMGIVNGRWIGTPSLLKGHFIYPMFIPEKSQQIGLTTLEMRAYLFLAETVSVLEC
jgi:hypothetical protein